jgi:transcriptional regulator with GAF, ATPase, and Fis domain
MTVSSVEADGELVPRQRDRRTGLGEVLAALARVLERRADPAALRTTFEEMLRQIVPVRSVQLRDSAYQWPKQRMTATETHTVRFDVTQGEAVAPAVLEAAFDPRARPGEWETQQLGAAASLAALVLEAERARPRTVHATLPPRPNRDGAAPLIGSTAAMRTLRSNIERVAGTDFTVLLEGGSGAQLESQFRL